MSRFLAITSLLLSGLVAVGCPVYGGGCESNSDCASGYECRNDSCVRVRTPGPPPGRCHTSDECPTGQVCDRFNRCVAGTPGGAGEGAGGAAGASSSAE